MFEKKKIILDLVHLPGGVFRVADHEFHGPRAVGEAENRLYGGPRGRDCKVPILLLKDQYDRLEASKTLKTCHMSAKCLPRRSPWPSK